MYQILTIIALNTVRSSTVWLQQIAIFICRWPWYVSIWCYFPWFTGTKTFIAVRISQELSYWNKMNIQLYYWSNNKINNYLKNFMKVILWGSVRHFNSPSLSSLLNVLSLNCDIKLNEVVNKSFISFKLLYMPRSVKIIDCLKNTYMFFSIHYYYVLVVALAQLQILVY